MKDKESSEPKSFQSVGRIDNEELIINILTVREHPTLDLASRKLIPKFVASVEDTSDCTMIPFHVPTLFILLSFSF